MIQTQGVTARELLKILRKRIAVILILPLLTALSAGFYNYYYLPDIYQASTTLIVVKTQAAPPSVEYSLLLANKQLVPTYSEIAKSRSVAMKVLDVTNVDLTYEQYYGMVDVQMVGDTELIQINVEDTQPGRAKLLANAAAAAFTEKVVEIMQINNIKIVDATIVPTSPIKPQRVLNIMTALFVSTMFSVLLAFLMEYFDNTLKTKDDVERYLNLPVLGSIFKIKPAP